ncbi:MAG: hypothetical protein EXR29_05540 [Betaproteobacteria bacterium]|nr:hypothetical protein [Betaproteobacteria bacterium]
MFKRSSRTRVAHLMLGLLLFTQVALAMAGCDWLRAAPALAIAASSSQPPCHEEPVGNPNFCLAHCLSADQSADTPQVAVPARVESPAIMVAEIYRWTGRAQNLGFVLPRPSAPPPRILL